jgi:hypothetical protein
MALSRATVLLLLLPCPAVVFLSASLEDVSASQQCLSSAEAVRQEFPGAWPSWTMQAANHKGTKCWFPATRENRAHHIESRVETPPPPRKNTVEQRRVEPDIKSDAAEDALLAAANAMSGLGWSFRSRSTRIGPATMFDDYAMVESSFDDRFAAAFEVSSVSQPSIIQRMMDPIGAIP